MSLTPDPQINDPRHGARRAAAKEARRLMKAAGKPTRTQVHDFPDPEMGKAIPYGVLDVGANEGWVNVGDDHDTPAFAVASIARWWERMGKARYLEATRLMITADAGGSNSYRSRAFKVELAKLAATIGARHRRAGAGHARDEPPDRRRSAVVDPRRASGPHGQAPAQVCSRPVVTDPGDRTANTGSVQPRGLRPMSTLRLATDLSQPRSSCVYLDFRPPLAEVRPGRYNAIPRIRKSFTAR